MELRTRTLQSNPDGHADVGEMLDPLVDGSSPAPQRPFKDKMKIKMLMFLSVMIEDPQFPVQ